MLHSSELEGGARDVERSGAIRRHLALAALGVLAFAHAVYLGCVAEDAHITFRFAQHVAEGRGFVWNLDEPPVEGFTTLLWVLLCAGAMKAGLDLRVFSQAVGLLAGVATLLITYRFARVALRSSAGGALFACLLLAACGPHATWASSGMETTAFEFTVLLGAFLYVRHQQTKRRSYLLASAFALAVGSVLRPEGGLVFAVLAALTATLFLERTRAGLISLVSAALVYALPMAALEYWRIRVFDDFLPNTAYAKMGGGLWQYVRGAKYAANFAHCFLAPFLPLLALALWEFGGAAARASSESRVRRFLALCRANPGVTTCASIALVYTTYIVSVGGDYMAMYRFFVPVLPFIYLSLVPPFDALLSSTGSGVSRKRGALAGAVAIAVLGTVFQSTPAERFFFPVPALQHGTYRGVQAERWNVARISLIGKYFEAHHKGPHDSVATNTIGCLGYYAPHIEVEDLNGLTDKYIAHRNVSGMGHGWAGHEKTDLDYSFHRLPTYFVLDRFFANDDVLRAGSSLSAVADALAKNYPGAKDYARWIQDHPDFIREHYRIVTTWLEDPENHEQGYFAYLERR